MYQQLFISAIHNKSKIEVVFFSKEDGDHLKRICAPMDFGPSRRTVNKDNRYHLWDYESDTKNHVLSLLPSQIVSMNLLELKFHPSEFVTWDCKWFVKRDWGKYS